MRGWALSTESSNREAHRELKRAVRDAGSAIARGLRLGHRILVHSANDPSEDGEIPNVGDFEGNECFLQALRLQVELEALADKLDIATNKKTGPRGKTRDQSVIEGLLLAWEQLNGKLPDPGNAAFQQHLIAAFEFLYPDREGPKDLKSAIRSVRDRLIADQR